MFIFYTTWSKTLKNVYPAGMFSIMILFWKLMSARMKRTTQIEMVDECENEVNDPN
jgi:hypothetical protein